MSTPSEDEVRHNNKRNRKFSAWLRRYERWHKIAGELSSINTLAAPFDGAAPEDVKAMKEIHRLICECRAVAEERLKEAEINDRILR